MSLREYYLTVQQTAEALGVTRQTIHRWLNDGSIEANIVGRIKLIDRKFVIMKLNNEIRMIKERIEKFEHY